MPRWFPTSLALFGVAMVVVVVLALRDAPPPGDAGAAVPTIGEATATQTASPTATATPTVTPTVEPTPQSPPDGDEVMLRLTDVPPGYMIGDLSRCGSLDGEGGDNRLNRLLSGEQAEFCLRQMNYVCPDRAVDFPLRIASAVLYLSSDKKSGEAMGMLPSLVEPFSMGPRLTPRPEQVEVGDGARIFDVSGLSQTPGMLIAWRNGATLNLIQVIDPAPEQAVFMVEALAQVQNGRFANPLEPDEADTYDVQVPLGCGESEAPVYWLDEVFEDEEGELPDVELVRSRGPSGEGAGPGDSYQLEYGTTSGDGEGFSISVWTAEQWEAFLSSPLGSGATSRPCSEPETIELSDRTIEIHSPVVGCSLRFMAHVLFEDAIVTVNAPLGLCCAGGPGAGPGVFDTPAALETIGRALERR